MPSTHTQKPLLTDSAQIWFQNRRQNDRRKSKPLQPHELLGPRSGLLDSSGQPLSDDNASAEPGSSSGAEQFDTNEHREEMASKLWHGGLLNFSDDSDPLTGDKDEHELPQSTQTSVATEGLEDTPPTTQEEFSQEANHSSEDSLLPVPKRKRSMSDIRGDGENDQQAANTQTTPTKSPPSLRLSMSFDGEAMVRKEGELTPSPPKSRSALRIAMSSDGKAVIRGENEPSPSKNRVAMFSVRRTKMSSLRRSSSAVFPATPRAGVAVAEKDRAFGRSRDPRNWESFCDTDARSALSTPSSGPNAFSPGLFHSRSQRSLPRSASGRHGFAANADLTNTPISQSMGEKRRKLARTVSSMGRLETGRNKANMITSTSKPSKPLFSKAGKSNLEMDPGDSDKENWVPGTQSANIRRRNTSHASRPVLRDANRNRGLGISTNGGKRNRALQAGSQGKVPDISAEVSAFMAGGSGDSQEDDDLDCVQGLLSLSQGAWR
jgi:hypothetical protein